MDCNCPSPTALTEIPAENCPFNMNQIQRVSFQRLSGEPFDTEADIKLLASWQAKETATTDDKIVTTPLIGGDPIIEAGEAITTGGGDNSTLNGVEEMEGTNPSTFSANFKGISPAQEKALKTLMCENNIGVFFHLQGGRTVSNDNYGPIPIQNVFISDRANAGFGTKDTNIIRFSLLAGWSENIVMTTPSFNPLTDL